MTSRLSVLTAAMLFAVTSPLHAQQPRPTGSSVAVTDFLPKGYVTDGSVSYMKELQAAIDHAAGRHATLVFPPMVYAVDGSGLQVRSGLTLSLYGAVFRVAADRQEDGTVFYGDGVRDVAFLGGEIAGRNDVWPDGVNVRGIHLTGACRNVRVRDTHIRDLSSNGLGVFGDPQEPARDVWVTDVVIDNCCNRYGDYLSARPGPEKGSKREDQGLIAFYHVRDFAVRGCRFERSRSDGTHFYRCKDGHFSDNRVYTAAMGGYFLETCEAVTAVGNVVRDNGSRGVTIERGSRDCTLQGNVVSGSGREGLWAPDCTGLVVTGNVFRYNGRKPNGTKSHHVWNANVTVNEDPSDPTKSPTADYLIADNLFYTGEGQVAAIRVNASKDTTGIVVRGNVLRGENRAIMVEGENGKEVVVEGNEGQ